MEGFIQLIKYREGDPFRERLSGLAGAEARRLGFQANQENFARLDEATPVHVYWNSREILSRSEEHFRLIEAAIRAKFNQNPAAAEQLLATGVAKLYGSS